MNEYGKKGQKKDASEMFKVITSIRQIERGIADLFEHKSKFVFSGDQTLLNKVFKDMRIDYKTEVDRAKSLRKKDKGWNNTLGGLNVARDVKNFDKLDPKEKHYDEDHVGELVDKLKKFHES